MKNIIMLLLVVALIVMTGCTPGATDGMVIADDLTLKSDKSRVEASQVIDESLADLSEGNGAFAFDLYRQLKGDGNLFYSPYSISAVLAMTYAGAAGDTGKQMAGVMHFELPRDELYPAFNQLEQELTSLDEEEKAETFRLHAVNAIWGQKDYKYKVSFLDTLAENYGAGLRIVDFSHKPDESRVFINNWISEQTEGRIQDMLIPQSITTKTRLLLTNAIYFKAAWQHKFMKESTTRLPFYLIDGNSVIAPMMKQTMGFGHMKGDNYQAVELPYRGNDVSMLILLPDEGKFLNFENNLDYPKVLDIITGLKQGNIDLTMPKFQFESGFSLKGALSALGITEAFSPNTADFSGMTDSKELWLDDVTHKASVSVDENGTEATAATVANMVASLPGSITINRPFIFLIRNVKNGSILFIGRVLNPGT
jgi:serpin B